MHNRDPCSVQKSHGTLNRHAMTFTGCNTCIGSQPFKHALNLGQELGNTLASKPGNPTMRGGIRVDFRLQYDVSFFRRKHQALRRFLHQENPKICGFSPLNCALNANGFNLVRAFPQTRCVKESNGKTAKVHPDFDNVARGARHIGRDCRITTCKPVEQGRFTDIGCTDNCYLERTPNALCCAAARNFCFKIRSDSGQKRANFRCDVHRHILIGKIDCCLKQRRSPDQ